MSHADYLAPLDEGQLDRLVEMAQQRLRQIREGGWVTLWVVAVGGACEAFFEKGEYRQAVAELLYRGLREETNGKQYDLTLDTGRYRPSEAADLTRSTAESIRKRNLVASPPGFDNPLSPFYDNKNDNARAYGSPAISGTFFSRSGEDCGGHLVQQASCVGSNCLHPQCRL